MPTHIVSVDTENCTGCGVCSSICPTNQGNELSESDRSAIELKGGVAHISLFDCTRCRRCIVYCPNDCIELKESQ